MSTPIHSLLCSPVTTSSPNPRHPSSPSASTSSHIRSFLLPDRNSRSPDLEGQGLKSRSPRSSTIPQFEATLTVPDYSRYPSKYSRSSPLSSPSQNAKPCPRNIPSRPDLSNGFTIPKPIVRLIAFLLLVAAGVNLLGRVPALQIPLLRAVNMRRGMIPASTGYVPPQFHSAKMMDRARAPKSTRTAVAFAAHPIPSSHELLALQSYLLQSEHNSLPLNTDPSLPLDGNAILDMSPTKLGLAGSPAEGSWLKELELERAEDVIIWAPEKSQAEVGKIYTMLAKYHPDDRSPALIHMAGRADAAILEKILRRLKVDVQSPMVMLGGKAVHGGVRAMVRMLGDGSLQSELKRIGWWDEKKEQLVEETEFKGIMAPEKVEAGDAAAEGGKVNI